MKYADFGLANTRDMFADAMARGYAVPAFNVYNMETIAAAIAAARETHSPIILAVSESALKYMGADMLMSIIGGLKLSPSDRVALHLDHGHTFDVCAHAITLGFSSVMIDASHLPFAENVALTRRVADLAHRHDVSTEAELGQLSGIEDETTFGHISSYTNPHDAARFVEQTNCDSLAIAIGTSHGAYKHKSDTTELRFDILSEITELLPNFPLVLHGASSIPQNLIKTINEYGGNITNARGIAPDQLRRAVNTNICKINVDSDLRLAFTAGVRKSLAENPTEFNPRDYLTTGKKQVIETCIDEIKNIMGSDNKLH